MLSIRRYFKSAVGKEVKFHIEFGFLEISSQQPTLKVLLRVQTLPYGKVQNITSLSKNMQRATLHTVEKVSPYVFYLEQVYSVSPHSPCVFDYAHHWGTPRAG